LIVYTLDLALKKMAAMELLRKKELGGLAT
jgi:hypothetical protein